MQRRLASDALNVCDFGCGSGVVSVQLAKAFPQSHFVGIDFDQNAIENARKAARRADVERNCRFECIDLSDETQVQRIRQQFDWITAFDAVHDQTVCCFVLFFSKYNLSYFYCSVSHRKLH